MFSASFSRPARLTARSLLAFALASAANAQILSDGDLDSLNVGTAPGCGAPNGAWGFPQNYLDAGVCEVAPEDFSVTETAEADPGLPGNSLETNIDNAASNSHLTNIFNTVIKESDGVITTVTFDIFVAEHGRGGGSVYVGGDHGGGGFSNGTDRGPQFQFFGDGQIIANVGGVQTPLGNFAFGKWTSLRIEIDLATDTYDLYAGPKGEDLTQIADGIKFRVAALDHLDRFSVAHFGATVASDHSYIDNVVVSVPAACYPDFTGDGTLDLFDFLGYVNAFNAGDKNADCDGDGNLTLFDFLCFVNAFNAGC